MIGNVFFFADHDNKDNTAIITTSTAPWWLRVKNDYRNAKTALPLWLHINDDNSGLMSITTQLTATTMAIWLCIKDSNGGVKQMRQMQ